MTPRGIDRLLSIASPATSTSSSARALPADVPTGRPWSDLLQVLAVRNGFYAFQSALHVHALESAPGVAGLLAWNDPLGWKADYGEMVERCWCFAEDLVGGQYCIVDDAIWKFEPETGERSPFAASLEEWADRILSDAEAETLWPLGEAWQSANRPLRPGERLVPRTPFVLGGEYAPENLYVADAGKAMRWYASLARQIRDLPDGATIELRAID